MIDKKIAISCIAIIGLLAIVLCFKLDKVENDKEILYQILDHYQDKYERPDSEIYVGFEEVQHQNEILSKELSVTKGKLDSLINEMERNNYNE